MSTNVLDSVRHTGHVKFFNSVKGFGFIIPDKQSAGNENEEVFVHHTAIYNNGGFKSLAEGEEVEYDLIQGPKGMQASNVTGPDGTPVKGDPRAPYHNRNQAGSGYRRNNYDNQQHYSNMYTAGGIYLDPYGMPMGQYTEMPMWAGPAFSTSSGNIDQQPFVAPSSQQQQGSSNNSQHQGYHRLPPQYHPQQQYSGGAFAPPMFQPGHPQQPALLHQPQPVVPPHVNSNTPMFLYNTDTPPFTNKSTGTSSPQDHSQQQQSPANVNNDNDPTIT